MTEISKDRLLAGARNLKAKGYTPQQVDAWLQTKGSSLDDMKSFVAGKSNGFGVSEEARAKIAQNIKNYEDKQANALVNNKHVRAGAALLQGIANSALNPAGYVARALGIDTEPMKAETATERALEKAGGYGFDAAVGALGGAALKGAGLLGQGAGRVSRIARALLAPGMGEAVVTAGSGGLVEGALDPKSTAGQILANIGGGTIGGGIVGALQRPSTKLVKSGLENILKNKDAYRTVRRAAKIDDDIAENISSRAAGVAEDINDRSYAALEQDLNGVSPKARYKDIRQAYNNFVKENQSKKVKGNWKDLPRLNPFQKKEYNKALAEGFDKAYYGSKEGDLGHLLTTRGVIDDAVKKSYVQGFPDKEATLDTAELSELRKKLDAILRKSGVKGADRMFELYRNFENAYETGLKYTPGGRRNVVLDDILAAGGDKEKAMYSRMGMRKGLFDALTRNITPDQNFSSQAKKFQNILRKIGLNGDDVVKELTRNERDYSRLAKLANTADNTLSTPEGTRFFGREQIESKGSAIGSIMDSILGRLNRGYYTQNAERMLNGNGEMVEILTNPAYLQRIINSAKGSLSAAERQALIDMLEKESNRG